MDILTFDKWQEVCIIETNAHEVVKCPECDGEGDIMDECSCCGAETVEPCEVCSGNCEVLFAKLGKLGQKKVFSKANYIEQVVVDITKLSAWTHADRTTLFVESGFTVYNLIRNKKEVVTVSE